MEPESSNDVRSAEPTTTAEEQNVVIRIPKARIKKLRRLFLPVLMVISLGMNCVFIYSYFHSGNGRMSARPTGAALQRQVSAGLGQPGSRGGSAGGGAVFSGRPDNEADAGDAGTDDNGSQRNPGVNRQDSGSKASPRK